MELKQAKKFMDGLCSSLLIVPYGIETELLGEKRVNQCNLLIVPYGIETYILRKNLALILPFNRTLWN